MPVYTVSGSRSLYLLNNFLSRPDYLDARLFILTDENTLRHCLPILDEHTVRAREAEVIEIPEGEENKDLQICEGIWESLAERGADRNSVLLNLGGGMITDLGGYIASNYMRGIRFLNIPTSLMAMADAAHGGKTGINFKGIKNLLGSFRQAEGTFIFPDFLESLPERQLNSGFAEVIKTSLISGEESWNYLKKKKWTDTSGLASLIKKTYEVKMSVVAADPFEKGIRKVLNFGHTIGHAIEAASIKHEKKTLLHGEAVAMGIICESRIAEQMGYMESDLLKDIITLIQANVPLQKCRTDADTLLKLMGYDKKKKDGKVRFSLLAAPGLLVIDKECPGKVIRESLSYYNKLY